MNTKNQRSKIQNIGTKTFKKTSLICKGCNKKKTISEFYPRIKKFCKTCHIKRCKAHFQKYYNKNKKKHLRTVKKYHSVHKEMIRFNSLKNYAKKHNIPFKLTVKEFDKLLAPPKTCHKTGKRLRYNKKISKPDSLYASRKTFRRGYERTNMEIVNQLSFYLKFCKRVK